jgi:hypothetical protein
MEAKNNQKVQEKEIKIHFEESKRRYQSNQDTYVKHPSLHGIPL